jgi:LuxR family maltose regulon positive regulatory protein
VPLRRSRRRRDLRGRAAERSAPAQVVAALLDDLAAAGVDVVLVLDDYHAIESHAVHEAMTTLVENLPSRVHVLLATRADPPFPLAR